MSDAQRTVTAPPPRPSATTLRVRIGGRAWAIPLAMVRAVVPGAAVTPVPGGPARVRGLIAWRGKVLALMDPVGARRSDLAVVVLAGESLFAIAVDAVEDFSEGEGEAPLDPAALGLAIVGVVSEPPPAVEP